MEVFTPSLALRVRVRSDAASATLARACLGQSPRPRHALFCKCELSKNKLSQRKRRGSSFNRLTDGSEPAQSAYWAAIPTRSASEEWRFSLPRWRFGLVSRATAAVQLLRWRAPASRRDQGTRSFANANCQITRLSQRKRHSSSFNRLTDGSEPAQSAYWAAIPTRSASEEWR